MIATRPSNWGHCRLLSSLVRQPGVRLTNAPAANHTRMRDTSSQAYTAGASPDKSAPPIASHEAVGVRYVGLRAEHSIHESGLDVGLRLGRPVYSACRMGALGEPPRTRPTAPPLACWRKHRPTQRSNVSDWRLGRGRRHQRTPSPQPSGYRQTPAVRLSTDDGASDATAPSGGGGGASADAGRGGGGTGSAEAGGATVTAPRTSRLPR
jgi:hypothetical protein